MACDNRQISQAQREAAYQQQRTGVVQALRDFRGAPTIENLLDYLNRELVPAVRAGRNAVNDVYLQVADNAPSANPLAYYFSVDTAASDPTDGRIKLNASPQDTATIIRVSQSNARLQDVTPWLDVMSGGPTTPLGTVTLVDAVNPGRFLRFDLNTMTDSGAYWDLGVTFIEGSHDDPFVADEAVVLGFIAGVSAAGSTVPVGSLSPIARDTFVGNIGTTTAPPVAVPLTSVDSTSIAYDTTAHEFQRAALTGFAVAAANSNATTSAEPIVTYSASANMSAERVTTSSTSITVDTATANQIEFRSAAKTGAISIAANANASFFAGIRDNGSAETDRTNLNFVSGDSNTAVVTDDAGNDELEVTYNYVGSTTNVNLTTLTGDQNVVDISTLRCGGSVTVESVSADYTIDGFTAKTDGFWFWFIDRRQSGATTGTLLEDIGSTTTSIRNEEEIETIVPYAGRALLYYFNGRWRVQSGNGRGRLLRVSTYAASASGTHTFLPQCRFYFFRMAAGGGGGGGANSAAAQSACSAGGGGGLCIEGIGTNVSAQAYSVGGGGSSGASSGGDGGTGTATTFGSRSCDPGEGGQGSASATGSGSGLTLRLTGPGGAGGAGFAFDTDDTNTRIVRGGRGFPGVCQSATLGWGGEGGVSGLGVGTGDSGTGGPGKFSANNADDGGQLGTGGLLQVWEYG